MFRFIKRNKNKNFFFLNTSVSRDSLVKYFDLTVFIKADRNTRLKRYLKSGGNIKIFNFWIKINLKTFIKCNFDHVVVNNKSQNVLKKNF